MKRDDLKNLDLSDEQVTAIMKLHGDDTEAHKAALAKKDEQITALTSERDGLQEQVKGRDSDIKELKAKSGSNEALTKQLSELQTKYDTETTNLKQKLTEQAVDHSIADYFGKLTFTSALAKKAAISEFKEKHPELKDGKFTPEGAEAFIKELRTSNPDAFPKEKTEDDPGSPNGGNPNPNGQPHKLPQFSGPIKPNDGKPDDGKTFNFGFTPLRTPDKK